jgi:tetratricopeptide (TPR) repeat protein
MICGRCGYRTAENSNYCPNCRWTLYVDTPEGAEHKVSLTGELPRPGGMLARRRQEGHAAKLEKQLRGLLDPLLEKLEETLEEDTSNFQAQRAMGLAMMLNESLERAHAHLQRAHEMQPDDFEAALNYGIVLAQRGQLVPALELLKKVRAQWSDNPLAIFNYALVALQARRAGDVLEAINALEKLWYDNEAIVEGYHDEAQTIRGLALLLQNKPGEAKVALEAAASHTVTLQAGGPNSGAGNGAGSTPGKTIPAANDDEDILNAIEVVKAPDPFGDEEAEIRQLEGKGTNADLLNNLAMAEAGLGLADAAVSRLYAALRMDPSHTRVLNNLGVLAYEQGQLDTAYTYLDTARQIEEFMERPDPVTSNHLGVVLSAMGRLDEGMTRFQRAGGHERAEFEVYYNLGRAYIEHGKPEAGVEHLRHAFQLNPHSPDVHVVLAAAYMLRNKPELLPEALKHLKRALQINSHHRIAFADLALALIDSDKKNDAAKVIIQALKVHPNSAETLFLLAYLVMQRGDEQHWAQASGQFGAVLDTRPDLIAALYNAALCQYLLGFRDTAAQQLQIVTDRDASFSPAYYLAGVGHVAGKRFNEALTAWLHALKYEPQNADLHCNIAFIHYHFKRYEEAIKFFMSAHRLEPMNSDILSSLGLSFARAERFDSAIESFRRSLEINPRTPITHSNLGLAYYLDKQVEKAIEHWRVVAQLDAGYARKKQEEEQRSFDDSIVSLRPLNWRTRVIRMAPSLPRPHTRLVPGFNSRKFRPAFSDATLQQVFELRQKLDEAQRYVAWMNIKH